MLRSYVVYTCVVYMAGFQRSLAAHDPGPMLEDELYADSLAVEGLKFVKPGGKWYQANFGIIRI